MRRIRQTITGHHHIQIPYRYDKAICEKKRMHADFISAQCPGLTTGSGKDVGMVVRYVKDRSSSAFKGLQKKKKVVKLGLLLMMMMGKLVLKWTTWEYFFAW